MPSRSAIALIVAFWLATLGFAFYREVWPRLMASGPPPLAIDLAEEASPNVSVKWTIYRGDHKIGRLTTHMSYDDRDDTFRQTHEYHQLEFTFQDAMVRVPQLKLTTRVNRAGELREQTMDGKLVVELSVGKFEAEVTVHGTVSEGVFSGRCVMKSPLGDIDQALDPAPVPTGQALNPLLVMNRINGLRGGQSWRVVEIDPLGDAVAALVNGQMAKLGLPTFQPQREPIFARVSASPEPLLWNGEEHECWVIEFRGRDAKAKTWVRVRDGKVLRQDAFGMGERLTIERND